MDYHTASPWGNMFTEDKRPSPVFKSLLRAIADHIILELEPKKARHLTPDKLATFYREVGGNLDPLFLETESSKLSDLFTILGCTHSLLPDPQDDFAPPSIPALHPRGFERWQVIQVLLEPDEHAPYMMEAVRKYPLIDRHSGNYFISEYGELPREAFPEGPDPDTEKWHEGVFRKRIADEREKEKQWEKDGWLPTENEGNGETKANGVSTGGATKKGSGPADAGGARPSSRDTDASLEGLGIRVDHPSESETGESYGATKPRTKTHSAARSPRPRSRGRGGYDSPSYSPQHPSAKARNTSSPSLSPTPRVPSKKYRRQPYSDSDCEYNSSYRGCLHPGLRSSKVHYVYEDGDEQSMDEANIRSVSPGDRGYTPSPPRSRSRTRPSTSRGRSVEPYPPYFTYGGYSSGTTPDERPNLSRGASPDPYAYTRAAREPSGSQSLNTSRSHGHLRSSGSGTYFAGNHSSGQYNSYPRRYRDNGATQSHSHSRSRGASPLRQQSTHTKPSATAGGNSYTRVAPSNSSSPTLTVEPDGKSTLNGSIPVPIPPPAPAVSSSSSTNPPVSTGGTSSKNTPKFYQATVSSDSEDDGYDFQSPQPSSNSHGHYNGYHHTHHLHPEIAGYHVNGLGISSGNSSSKRYYEQEFLNPRREKLRGTASYGVSMGGSPYSMGVGIGGGNLVYTPSAGGNGVRYEMSRMGYSMR